MCLNLMWENDIALVCDIADKICFASRYKIHSNRKERYSTYDEKSYDSYISSNQSTSTPIKKNNQNTVHEVGMAENRKKKFLFFVPNIPSKISNFKKNRWEH
jgi:hypothetical protein